MSKLTCKIKGHDWYHLDTPGVDITYCMRCGKLPTTLEEIHKAKPPLTKGDSK